MRGLVVAVALAALLAVAYAPPPLESQADQRDTEEGKPEESSLSRYYNLIAEKATGMKNMLESRTSSGNARSLEENPEGESRLYRYYNMFSDKANQLKNLVSSHFVAKEEPVVKVAPPSPLKHFKEQIAKQSKMSNGFGKDFVSNIVSSEEEDTDDNDVTSEIEDKNAEVMALAPVRRSPADHGANKQYVRPEHDARESSKKNVKKSPSKRVPEKNADPAVSSDKNSLNRKVKKVQNKRVPETKSIRNEQPAPNSPNKNAKKSPTRRVPNKNSVRVVAPAPNSSNKNDKKAPSKRVPEKKAVRVSSPSKNVAIKNGDRAQHPAPNSASKNEVRAQPKTPNSPNKKDSHSAPQQNGRNSPQRGGRNAPQRNGRPGRERNDIVHADAAVNDKKVKIQEAKNLKRRGLVLPLKDARKVRRTQKAVKVNEVVNKDSNGVRRNERQGGEGIFPTEPVPMERTARKRKPQSKR